MTEASHPAEFQPPPLPRAAVSNGLAIAALACGILGIPLFFFPAPALAAVILGILGHRRARDLGGEIMAAVAVALGVVVLIVFSALLIRNFDDITHTSRLADVQAGTCLKEMYPEDPVVRQDCSARHGSEVVAMVQHPAPPGAAYPKGFELNFQALDECRSPFADYVGVPSEQSSSELYVQYPSEAEWNRGARTITCFAIGRDGAPLLGSMRGTGRTR